MKIALVLAFVVFTGTAVAQKPDRARTLDQLKGLIKLQGDEITRVENDLKASKEYATTLWTDLDRAQKQVNQVGTERDGWKAYGEDQHEKLMNAEKRVAELKHSNLKWKISFFGLIALIGAFVWFKLSPLGRFSPI